MTKASSDEKWMREALAEAELALEQGEVPVGAVVVRAGEVIGRGRNEVETRRTATAHAEILAIDDASGKTGDWRLDGCSVYVTSEPCHMCLGALYLARAERARHESTNGNLAIPLTRPETMAINPTLAVTAVGWQPLLALLDGADLNPEPASQVLLFWLDPESGRPEMTAASADDVFAAAGEAMRRILVDDALRKKRPKHGGDRQRVQLDVDVPGPSDDDEELLAVNEAVERLARIDSEAAEIVNLKYFAGLTNSQIADALGISPRTVDRRWSYARAWLHQELTAK